MVTFLRSGLAVPWDRRFGSLLRIGGSLCRSRALGLPIGGMPQLRESLDRKANFAYAPEPLDPPAEGNALICCATPKTAVELDLSSPTYFTSAAMIRGSARANAIRDRGSFSRGYRIHPGAEEMVDHQGWSAN